MLMHEQNDFAAVKYLRGKNTLRQLCTGHIMKLTSVVRHTPAPCRGHPTIILGLVAHVVRLFPLMYSLWDL